jgi:hypothetical protein
MSNEEVIDWGEKAAPTGAAESEEIVWTGPTASPSDGTSVQNERFGELKDFGLRTRLGFASTPQEQVDILNGAGVKAFLDGNKVLAHDPKSNKAFPLDDPNTFNWYDVADLVGEVPEFVGSIIGAAAGFVSGGPLGAMAGGGIGAAGGSSAKTNVAHTLGAKVTVNDELRRMEQALLWGSAGEGGGQVLFKGAQKVLAPFSNKLVKGHIEANAVLNKYRDADGKPLKLTPMQATDSWSAATMENIAGKSLFGSAPLRAHRASQDVAMDDAVRELVNNIGRGTFSPEEIGATVKAAIEKKGGLFREWERSVWAEVDKLSPDKALVDVTKLRKWAQEKLKSTAQARALVPAIAGGKEAGDTSASTIVKALEQFASLPDRISFSTSTELISSMSAMTRGKAGEVLNQKHAGILRDMNRRLNLDVDEAGKVLATGSDTNLKQAYDFARSFSKEWQETFNNKLVNTLAEAEPQKVADILFRPKQITSIREARKAMSAGAFQRVKGAFVESIFASGDAAKIAKKLGSYDDATLREIFGKGEELTDIQNLAKTIELVQKKPVGAPGGVAIQLMQPGAVVQLVGGFALAQGFPKTAAAIVLAPPAMAKVFASPTGAKWLTTGFKVGAKTEMASRVVSQLVRMTAQGERGEYKGVRFLTQDEYDDLVRREKAYRDYENNRVPDVPR